jgi:teichuronic acid biosynthesis glycosyltransferase TuaG
VIKVSIIIPTYNSAPTLRNALKSIFRQTYKNFEVIILDSYSTDNTFNIIEEFKSKKIRVIRISKNKKLSQVRYVGITKATGKYIAFLDSDDVWDRRKLKTQLTLMGNSKFSSTAFNLVKNNKKMKIDNFPKYLNLNDLIYSRPIANSSVIVKKDLIQKIAKQYQNVDYAEDYLWWLKIMSKLGRTMFINKVLVEINIKQTSRTNMNFFRNLKSLFFIYKKILNFNMFHITYIFYQLIKKNFKKKYFYYYQ